MSDTTIWTEFCEALGVEPTDDGFRRRIMTALSEHRTRPLFSMWLDREFPDLDIELNIRVLDAFRPVKREQVGAASSPAHKMSRSFVSNTLARRAVMFNLGCTLNSIAIHEDVTKASVSASISRMGLSADFRRISSQAVAGPAMDELTNILQLELLKEFPDIQIARADGFDLDYWSSTMLQLLRDNYPNEYARAYMGVQDDNMGVLKKQQTHAEPAQSHNEVVTVDRQGGADPMELMRKHMAERRSNTNS